MKITFLLIIFLIKLLTAQPTKQYIMAVHTCTTCGDPSFHTTRILESNDGSSWTQIPGSGFTFAGSVPEPIIRGDKLYVYTPGKVNIYNAGTNTWEDIGASATIYTDHTKTTTVSYVDPSAIVDGFGKINLFFLNSTGIVGDPAICSSYPCTKFFDSAIEIEGSNGKEFILTPGHRLSLTISSGSASDPDIYYDGTNYYLYISRGTSTYAYYSSSLNGVYNIVSSLPGGEGLLTSSGGIPCGYYNASGSEYWTYVHSGSTTEVKRKVHSDFTSTLSGFTTVVDYSTLGLSSGTSVASPGFVVNTLSTLPVELLDFNCFNENNRIVLSWTTINETNNYGFFIQRKNEIYFDNWEDIGFVAGYGNSNSLKDYIFFDNNPLSGKSYYRLKQVDTDGKEKFHNAIEVVFNPSKFKLHQNYPNPFNPETKISFELPYDTFISIKLYDLLGNEIETITENFYQVGVHSITYNTLEKNIPSGIYFYQLVAGEFSDIKKITLIK